MLKHHQLVLLFQILLFLIYCCYEVKAFPLKAQNDFRKSLRAITISEEVSSHFQVNNGMDLFPYDSPSQWGPRRSHHEIQAMYKALLGNATGVFSIWPAARDSNPLAPADITHFRVTGQATSLVIGHAWILKNPVGRFSVQEPGDSSVRQGCAARTLSRTSSTSSFKHCRVATNAGFFDPMSQSPTFGKCLGNLVVDGNIVQAPGTQNANFGLLKNGSFISGYIPPEMVSRPDPRRPGHNETDFEVLVGGVVMLVKDGKSFVDTSALLEDPDTQTTGPIDVFINVRAGRTALGHDSHGNFILFSSDGKTNERGVNLHEMAEIMMYFGAINAVNLDGGGSVSVAEQSVLVNMPSDSCPGDGRIKCERPVSTIICIHDGIVDSPPPICPPPVKCPPNECPPFTIDIPGFEPNDRLAPKPAPGSDDGIPKWQEMSTGWKVTIILAVALGGLACLLLLFTIHRVVSSNNKIPAGFGGNLNSANSTQMPQYSPIPSDGRDS